VTGETKWSDETRRMLGYGAGEIVPSYEAYWARVHPDDRAAVEAEMAGLSEIREDSAILRPHRVLLPDGTVRWCASRGRVTHRVGGIPTHTTGLLEDITERKQWEDTQKALIAATVEAEQALRESNERLAEEAQALARLDEAGSRLWRANSMSEGLNEMLSATTDLLGADMGAIQILDPGGKVLRVVAQRGIDPDFLERFQEISAGDDTVCGRALRMNKPVVVEDVELHAPSVSLRSIARADDYRAFVLAPLIGRRGRPVGVLSAYFRSPHRPSVNDLRRLDLYRRRATDFIERFRSEAALLESEERLRLAVEAGRMGAWDWEIATGEMKWSDGFYRILGYGAGEIVPGAASFSAQVHPDDRAAVEAEMARLSEIREDETIFRTFRLLLPDGTVRWCSSRGRTVHSAAGGPTRMIGLLEDITERKQWEETQKVLVAELEHRTRNLMAVVQSIAQQTMETAKSLEEFEVSFNRRIEALGRVQSLLSRSDSRPVAVGTLVSMELEALDADALGDKITLGGPKVLLRKAAVQMLTLAIHELATNALKYGALASEVGRMSVTWRIEGTGLDRRLALEWVERGIAPPPVSTGPTRRGYGRTLIEEALPYSLSARTRFELGADSLRCVISLPLATQVMGEMIN
jgi:PAS domain S-box-containing protein